jgi:hypothetical protein
MILKNFKINQNNIANKLILGTVKFGKSYGISNNQNKKVNTKHQKKILKVKQKSDIIDNKGMHRILYTIYNLYNKNLLS